MAIVPFYFILFFPGLLFYYCVPLKLILARCYSVIGCKLSRMTVETNAIKICQDIAYDIKTSDKLSEQHIFYIECSLSVIKNKM